MRHSVRTLDTSRRGSLAARIVAAVVLVVVASAVGVVGAQVSDGPTANVRDYGAKGDGATNDTAAIQRANDAVAAQGGGTVLFPPGVYEAINVKQDSNVQFLGTEGATLRHRNGTSSPPIVGGRTTNTRGNINAGTTQLTVASAKRIVPGATIGVQAAAGPSSMQTTTLSLAATASSPLFLKDREDWRLKSRNYLWIENELISYAGMSGSMLMNVRRGVRGTKAVSHPAGARVSQAQGLVARVAAVSGLTVVLDRAAARTIRSADVWVGSSNMSVRGLSIDGGRVESGSTGTSPVASALHYAFAQSVSIENNTIRNAAHGAVSFVQGTTDSLIAGNVLWDNGVHEQGWGSAVWLFQGSTRNTVRDNLIGGNSNHGVAIDDRSEGSTEWDASSDENIVLRNAIDIPPVDGQAAIFVAGSNRNEIAENDLRATKRGVAVAFSTQGINPGDSEGNLVRDNRLSTHSWGLHVTGSYNRFERNTIDLTERPIVDDGVGNSFV